jgi:hypothetical protein
VKIIKLCADYSGCAADEDICHLSTVMNLCTSQRRDLAYTWGMMFVITVATCIVRDDEHQF